MNNLPDTSLEAYRALTPEKLAKDYQDIVCALKVLGAATYEEIGNTLCYNDLGKVSRRLKEMESLQLIFKKGDKRRTKRNRLAYVYRLIESENVL